MDSPSTPARHATRAVRRGARVLPLRLPRLLDSDEIAAVTMVIILAVLLFL